ncbi:hypothetical protein ACBJ59_26410 [Nonomuraea sp. MTCD27]|uniref:hypothetical protein n=1 Tax=Nonomuraea sp. MTCD27 TaxID=1676747 RepID=UPI0035C08207
MALFTSQFDRVREESRAYAGEASETRFRVPAAVAVAGGAALVTATDPTATESGGWGEGWDQGWDAGAGAAAGPGAEPVLDDGGGAWSHHGDYTGASVGGDGDFFYFIDGDSSLTIG